MKAMILAAGLGTRLRPLTDNRPKALVEVGGRTLLEITLARLRAFGVRDVIINVHHFGDMVVDYLKRNSDFGMRVEISREEILLDTGGGLEKASYFFLDGSDEPFVLHNVDVISTIDLERMVQFHRERKALATLAVQERESSRYLLFDEKGRLCGRRAGREQGPDPPLRGGTGESPVSTRTPVSTLEPASTQAARALAFSGIHVISPRLLSMMTEEGAFSIVTSYLRLAAQGDNILGFRADEYYWRDLGRPENVARAEQDFRNNAV
jgi:mannose-1-phosphate guanylyltransferase